MQDPRFQGGGSEFRRAGRRVGDRMLPLREAGRGSRRPWRSNRAVRTEEVPMSTARTRGSRAGGMLRLEK